MLIFKQAHFVTEVKSLSQLPVKTPDGRLIPEIAFVGKSNVGKSSLINDLTGFKGLAKTSSTPGKTRSLIYFLIDEKIHLVDLPGYGYAKISKSELDDWSDLIETYFHTRDTLKTIIVLIDLRRGPQENDLAFLKWAKMHRKKFICVFTKADKLNQKETQQQIKTSLEILGPDVDYVVYSTLKRQGRPQLISLINRSLAQV